MIPTLEAPRFVLRSFATEACGTVEALAGDGRVAVTTLNIPRQYPADCTRPSVAAKSALPGDPSVCPTRPGRAGRISN